jgi:cyclopropane fatty-acyl-phospholipid synthase-like methyltransferase
MTFTTEQTAEYYDNNDSRYRSIWAENGDCRWGLFAMGEQTLEEAMSSLTTKMTKDLHLDNTARVLDLGCGNGIATMDIFEEFDCTITGIDISNERISFANKKCSEKHYPGKIQFMKGDMTDLSYFGENSHDAILSQAAIYHCHEKEKLFQEVYRVLRPGGRFVVTDACRRDNHEITENGKTNFYDRLLFSPEKTHTELEYMEVLQNVGFLILTWHDITDSMIRTYEIVSKKIKSGDTEKLRSKIKKSIKAIEDGDVAHVYFIAEKPV